MEDRHILRLILVNLLLSSSSRRLLQNFSRDPSPVSENSCETWSQFYLLTRHWSVSED